MIEDIASHTISNGCYAIEFEVQGPFLLMHIRFWEDKQFCRVFLRRTGRTVNQTSAEICLISHLLGAISSQTSLVSVNGCTGELIPKLDQSKLFKFGVSSSIRFAFSVTTLMHKGCYSVFERIDFFSVLQYLVVTLRGSLEQDRIPTTPELSKVSMFYSGLVILYYAGGLKSR